MGNNNSSDNNNNQIYDKILNDLNHPISHLVSIKSIPLKSNYWMNNFNNLDNILSGYHHEEVISFIYNAYKLLAKNYKESNNFQTLIIILIYYIEHIPQNANNIPEWLLNLIFITRVFIMNINDNMSYDERILFFQYNFILDNIQQDDNQHYININNLIHINDNNNNSINLNNYWNTLELPSLIKDNNNGNLAITLLYSIIKVISYTKAYHLHPFYNEQEDNDDEKKQQKQQIDNESKKRYNGSMLELHLECVNLFITLFSTQIYGPLIPEYENFFIDILFNLSSSSSSLNNIYNNNHQNLTGMKLLKHLPINYILFQQILINHFCNRINNYINNSNHHQIIEEEEEDILLLFYLRFYYIEKKIDDYNNKM